MPATRMELVKGVHVIETYATTTLLVDDRLVLIDTSSDADAGKLLDYLTKIKVKPNDLSTIFITHTHPDHVNGLAAIKHGSPAKVASSRIEADFISRKRVYDGPSGPQRHPGTPVDVLLDDGQAHDGLRVIFTPGHTRGSISLLDETRSLCIAGDALNNEAGLRPMPDKYNVDPKQHRESIKKLATFHFENMVMGHGAPIKGGAAAKVAELAKRL
ncbi:MAG TPA: MBL fold metallo-hydrolase [Thermoplasmata archaeon]|nr:MBL fold metallo-hydrolase [Thermoplasmata archaeon]